MTQTLKFNAPWGTALRLITGLSILASLGIPVIGIVTGPRDSAVWILSMIVLPLLILTAAAFFLIRGYDLIPDTLLVQRLGWNSKINLSGLVSAEADPQAMAKSIRTFGNGGMFCFTGAYRNKKLGAYRAFATDFKKAVVLRFDKRIVVVTPENPAYFVSRIREIRNLQGI